MTRHSTASTLDNAPYCPELSLHLPNSLEAVLTLAEAVADFGQQQNWDASIAGQINLALEELVVNAICHGYADGRKGHIDVLVTAGMPDIHILVTDDGDAFDPFAYTTIDLSLDIAERPIGGLGVFLVRQIMDSYAYRYINQHNQVTLTKCLPPETNHD